MKIDIPYYIRQVLREQRTVHVPGIGTFSLDQSPASFNEDKSQLNPPYLNIGFDDQDSDNESLFNYILDTGHFTEEKIRRKIDQYTQLAFNTLLNVDSFKIEGLGSIQKESSDSKVAFVPTVNDFTKELQGLKPLGMVPIQRINEQTAPVALVPSSPVVDESGSLLPRILVLSILLIALYFIGKHFYDKNKANEKDATEIGAIQKDGKDVKLAMTDSSDLELEQKYEEIDELIDPSKKGKKGNTKSDPKSATSSKVDVPQDTDDNSSNENDKEGKNSTGLDKSKKDESDMVEADSSIENSDSSNQNKNKHAEIIPESGKCIIVVGSFKKSRNTVRMVSLLERKGYTVHQSQHQDFTRVGLVYECLDEDLEAFLQDIRKKISKKAWYLDPELEVPYLK